MPTYGASSETMGFRLWIIVKMHHFRSIFYPPDVLILYWLENSRWSLRMSLWILSSQRIGVRGGDSPHRLSRSNIKTAVTHPLHAERLSTHQSTFGSQGLNARGGDFPHQLSRSNIGSQGLSARGETPRPESANGVCSPIPPDCCHSSSPCGEAVCTPDYLW